MLDGISGASKPLVLVVEDEAALVTMLRYNLEKQGFRVEEAADGQEKIGDATARRQQEMQAKAYFAQQKAAHSSAPADPVEHFL